MSRRSRQEEDRRLEQAAILSETMRVLHKSGSNVVAELQHSAVEVTEWQHLPPGDALDEETGSQYYYHSHAKDDAGGRLTEDEHGHFHTFVKDAGALVHIAGISMNALGAPIGLFTVNSWVTGEQPRGAQARAALLERFEMDVVRPSWPVNLWLTSLLRLFRDDLVGLFREHDSRLAAWGAARLGVNPLEDRGLEMTAFKRIDLEAEVRALECPDETDHQRCATGM